MGDDIRIRMIGGFAIRRGGTPLNFHLSGPTRQLFAYLLFHHGEAFRREALTVLLWPDKEPEKARSALNTALWRIRKAVGGQALEEVTFIGDTEQVGLALAPTASLDAHQLADLVRWHDQASAAGEASSLPAIESTLAELLDGSRGLFLEGEDADWVLVERERLINTYMRGQALLLATFADQNRFDRALACGHDMLAIDPLHEGVQRQVMRLYMLNGQRARAVRQYHACADMLESELGIPPMPETRALLHEIVHGTDTGDAPGDISSPRTDASVTSRPARVDTRHESGATDWLRPVRGAITIEQI